MSTLEKLMQLNHVSEEEMKPKESPEEQIAELKEQNQMLIDCLLEMADIIYA